MGATAAGDLVGKILSGIKAGDIARNEILLIPAAVGIEGVRDGLRKPATADRLPSLFTILSNGIPIGRRAMSGRPAGCRCKSPAGAGVHPTSRGTSRRAFPRSTLLRSSPLNTVATPLVCSAPVR